MTVNGRPTETRDVKRGRLVPDEYRLYELYAGEIPMTGVIKLETTGPVAAYAFTFG